MGPAWGVSPLFRQLWMYAAFQRAYFLCWMFCGRRQNQKKWRRRVNGARHNGGLPAPRRQLYSRRFERAGKRGGFFPPGRRQKRAKAFRPPLARANDTATYLLQGGSVRASAAQELTSSDISPKTERTSSSRLAV